MDSGGVGTVRSLREWAGEAIAHLERRLRFETDVSDVHAAMDSGAPGRIRVLGARGLPRRDLDGSGSAGGGPTHRTGERTDLRVLKR
jgi:hypothetical protein